MEQEGSNIHNGEGLGGESKSNWTNRKYSAYTYPSSIAAALGPWKQSGLQIAVYFYLTIWSCAVI